MHLISMRCWSI